VNYAQNSRGNTSPLDMSFSICPSRPKPTKGCSADWRRRRRSICPFL